MLLAAAMCLSLVLPWAYSSWVGHFPAAALIVSSFQRGLVDLPIIAFTGIFVLAALCLIAVIFNRCNRLWLAMTGLSPILYATIGALQVAIAKGAEPPPNSVGEIVVNYFWPGHVGTYLCGLAAMLMLITVLRTRGDGWLKPLSGDIVVPLGWTVGLLLAIGVIVIALTPWRGWLLTQVTGQFHFTIPGAQITGTVSPDYKPIDSFGDPYSVTDSRFWLVLQGRSDIAGLYFDGAATGPTLPESRYLACPTAPGPSGLLQIDVQARVAGCINPPPQSPEAEVSNHWYFRDQANKPTIIICMGWNLDLRDAVCTIALIRKGVLTYAQFKGLFIDQWREILTLADHVLERDFAVVLVPGAN